MTDVDLSQCGEQSKLSPQENVEIVRALIDERGSLTDEQLHGLLSSEPSIERRKRLVMSLKCAGRITDEQCTLMFYAFDLREA